MMSKRPEWITNHNILIQDLMFLVGKLIAFVLLVFAIVFYPIFCIIYNKDEVNQIIKEMFGYVFLSKKFFDDNGG